MSRSKTLIWFGVVAVALVVADRISKVIAIDVLTGAPPQAFVPQVLDFVLVYNRGGAFGVFEGGGIAFVLIAVAAVCAILVYLARARHVALPLTLSLAAIAAGACGNAWDRLVGGAVPDFIHTLFIEFPVFNVADCCLTVGEIVLFVALVMRYFVSQPAEDALEQPLGQALGEQPRGEQPLVERLAEPATGHESDE